MIKAWDDEAWEDFLEWNKQDKRMFLRIQALIKAVDRHSYDTIGKPEPLKHKYAGYYSLRIDKYNRLVFKIEGDTIIIASCKGHYDK